MAAGTGDPASLSEVERLLVDHVERGEVLDLAGEEPVDAAAMRSWSGPRIVRAWVLRDILLGRLAPDPDPYGLRLRGARILGGVELENLTTTVPVELVHCYLDQGMSARGARIPYLSLEGCRVEDATRPALSASRLAAPALFLDKTEFICHGEDDAVRLQGARLGQLHALDAKFSSRSGVALNARSMRVEEMTLLVGMTAAGNDTIAAVRLTGARLGWLDCTSATIRNESGPALDAVGLQVDQAAYVAGGFAAVGSGDQPVADLSGVRITGALLFDPDKIENTTNPEARLNLDGLTYTGLPVGLPLPRWLRLLRDGTPDYRAQPYQQLAAVYRAAGHDSEVRRILIAQRRDQIHRRALTGRGERAWVRITGLTLGYGYQPWRALLALLAITAVAVTLAVTLGSHGALARTAAAGSACTTTEQVGVGLDLGLPLVKTGARDRCNTTFSTTGQVLMVAGWSLQVLGWAFATLFVAGLTGAVRKT
jgi:hypothetical protein